jgi:hypothetical protein
MTPLSASNTLSPTPRFSQLERIAPQIQAVARVTAAQWLFSAVAQLREIESSGEAIPGVGDFRIGLDTTKRARQILSSIDADNIPSPLVAPVSGGGVSFTWQMGDREVKLAVEAGGAAYWLRFENDELLDDPDEQIAGPLTDQLRWLIGRRS